MIGIGLSDSGVPIMVMIVILLPIINHYIDDRYRPV